MIELIHSNKKLLYHVCVALMAALCFAGTFINIPIPVAVGNTMIHLGNTLCLLAALLLGGSGGGLSGGIGMALFDLSSAAFAAYAPFTFVQKFLAGFVCGKIAFMRGKNGGAPLYNFLGAAAGGIVNVVFAQINAVIVEYLILGSALGAVLTANIARLGISLINMGIAVTASLLIAVPIRFSLKKLNMLDF